MPWYPPFRHEEPLVPLGGRPQGSRERFEGCSQYTGPLKDLMDERPEVQAIILVGVASP